MEILRFVRCESFPEEMRMLGCICDEEASCDPQVQAAVLWVISPTDTPPIARRMTAADARLVQQRYTPADRAHRG